MPNTSVQTLSNNQESEAKWPSVVLMVVGISSFMVALDVTALNVALMSIGRDFSTGLNMLQWVVGAYTLIFASFLLTAGTLSDLIGAKKVFITALCIFTLASLACSFSENITFLIISRIFQGIGAAILLPSSMALLTNAFPDPQKRSQAVAIWGGISAIALVTGPIIGGLLVETLGWRSIFAMNVPFCMIAIMGTLIASGTPQAHTRSFDFPGQILAIIFLISITFVFIEGPVLGWRSIYILSVILVTICSAILFYIVESHQRDPMLPIELFTSQTFSASISTAFLQTLAYYGTLFIIPLALQAKGMKPMQIGFLLLPMTIATAIFAIFSAKISEYISLRIFGFLGMFCGGIGSVLLSLSGLNYWSLIVGGVLIGLGGATLPIIVGATLASVPLRRIGIGSGVLNAARQSGGTFGVAILGSLLYGSNMDSKFALLMIALSFFFASILTFFYLYRKEN
ncbi:MFS transporter [Acinetobacter baumannii]|uniref:MFS transporter n=1 Tax=Acinetobacter baumannii TaxID=470 RepID=UPI002341305D|nr:MFS transporter [Acinetobacter baumannii]MDC4414433.1 MFS transporter [Acinetobacter baumannii]MDH2520310.1 MFS transporter [Acinetobacter baumannii]MDK2200815.1 MFS transporter [Acinetobacter baumannii]